MQLSTVKIENFRGIRYLELDFNSETTVLIGENNTGKTSVLEALRLCLDAVKSNKTCNFSELDFYRDDTYDSLSSCAPINITLSFRESENAPWPDYIHEELVDVIVGAEYAAIKLRVAANYDANVGELSQEWCFLDDDDNELAGRANVIKTLRRLRPFFFQSALRAAKDQFHGQSTYWSSFLKNKDIDDDTRVSLEEELTQVNQKIVDAHGSFSQVTEEVQRISELVSVGQTDVVSVDAAPVDIYKALRYNTDVNLLTESNAKIPVRSHGEGTQSLSVLLLFSAYLKARLPADTDIHAEPIIAIEEPEAHLHPNAVRAVWHLLKDLPGQKIIATHSGDILSEVPVSNLRRLSRHSDNIECSAIPDSLLNKEELRKLNHHVQRNRGELFFARCWILVEGETDLSVLNECADLLDLNFHRLGIRIVECSQAGGPGAFIKVADSLSICWHLVADSDPGGQKYITTARELLGDRQSENYISALNYPNIDVLLCNSGFGSYYLEGVGPNKQCELDDLVEGSPEYWEQVYKIVNKARGFSKPEAALKAVLEMRDSGSAGVPDELRHILLKISDWVSAL